ncbi:MAG TPA: NlpC/P60 family protein [Microvirga sp.]|jgi:cell wall-associated NlpC family hydrolase|nr:NlpC/P60 family protein [Microvirga sp.]
MSFDRRVTPHRPDLADERLRGQVEAERFSAGTVMRVSAPSTGVRRHPSPDAPLDTEALMGELVTVYDEHEGWAWGQIHTDGYVGYLSAEALSPPHLEPTHRIGALRTFVYQGPNLKLPVMGFLTLNAAVAVTERQGEYARLATGGWVHAAHLTDLDAHAPDFVAVAERFVGTPYLWGGRTSLGLDCSGLVQTALAAAGIAAPRDSDMQEAALGNPVALRPDLSGLARGDLVFWKGHVGIMLDAERLIHANGTSMDTWVEPLGVAEARIRVKSYGPITSVKRLGA